MRLITEFHEFHEFNIKLNVRTFGISMKYCWVLVKFAKVNEKEYLRNNFGYGRFERRHVGLALYLHVLKRMSFKDMVYVQSTKTEIHFQEKFGGFKNFTKAQKYLIPINRIQLVSCWPKNNVHKLLLVRKKPVNFQQMHAICILFTF